MTAPMTISLEEHVARAIRRNLFARTRRGNAYDETVEPTDNELDDARAAIAAMREREGVDPDEAMRAQCEDIVADERFKHHGADRALCAVADRIYALKGNGEGK